MSTISVSCDGYDPSSNLDSYAGDAYTDAGEYFSIVAYVSDVPMSGNLPSTSCPFGGVVSELTVRDEWQNPRIEFVQYNEPYYYNNEMYELAREIADHFEYI